MVYRLSHNLRSRLRRRRYSIHGSFLAPEGFLLRQKLIQPIKGFPQQLAELVEAFRQQPVFRWQRDDPAQLQSFFQDSFPEETQRIRSAADAFRQHRFEFFGQPLSFGKEIDWHYDPVRQSPIELRYWTDIPYWQEELVPGVKSIWELNRHQHFVTLAQAYYLSRDRSYAAELFGQWQHWLQANPFPYGINWCSSLEAGLRLISWTWSLQFAKGSSYLTPLFYSHLLQSVEQHADYIADHLSFYSSANNHLLGEAVGLIYAGCYFTHLQRAAQWQRIGWDLFFKEFLRQVHPDGVAREQSTHYQIYVFYYALLTWLATECSETALPSGFRERMEKMAEFVFALLDQSGQLPAIGDEDGGQVLLLSRGQASPACRLLSAAAVLFQRRDYLARCRHVSPESLWLFGRDQVAAAAGASTTLAVEDTIIHFSQGGYVTAHGTVENCAHRLILDAGPLGLDRMASHGHADALSLLLSVNGQPVLIDSGTFTYRGQPGWRDYFRSTRAHNTVVIDSKNQSQIVGPFQWGRRANARFIDVSTAGRPLRIEAEQDGYKNVGVVHRRVVRQEGGKWIVEDSLLGRGRHRIELFWHLAPGETGLQAMDHLQWRSHELTADFFFKSSVPFTSRIIDGSVDPIQGWYSREFGIKNRDPVLCITTFCVLPMEIATEIEIRKK